MSGCGCKCGSNCSCGSDCKCGRSFDESTLLMREAGSDMSVEYVASGSSAEDNGCKCGPNCTCNDCQCHK